MRGLVRLQVQKTWPGLSPVSSLLPGPHVLDLLPGPHVLDCCRARAEVLLCGAQGKAVTREGTKPGFIHHLELEQDLLAMEHCPDAIPTREVWLQQAQLLVEQVCHLYWECCVVLLCCPMREHQACCIVPRVNTSQQESFWMKRFSLVKYGIQL